MQSECQHEEGQEQEQPSSFYEFEINKYERIYIQVNLHTTLNSSLTQHTSELSKVLNTFRVWELILPFILKSLYHCKHLWFDHSLYLNPIPLKHINILKKWIYTYSATTFPQASSST